MLLPINRDFSDPTGGIRSHISASAKGCLGIHAFYQNAIGDGQIDTGIFQTRAM